MAYQDGTKRRRTEDREETRRILSVCRGNRYIMAAMCYEFLRDVNALEESLELPENDGWWLDPALWRSEAETKAKKAEAERTETAETAVKETSDHPAPVKVAAPSCQLSRIQMLPTAGVKRRKRIKT